MSTVDSISREDVTRVRDAARHIAQQLRQDVDRLDEAYVAGATAAYDIVCDDLDRLLSEDTRPDTEQTS